MEGADGPRRAPAIKSIIVTPGLVRKKLTEKMIRAGKAGPPRDPLTGDIVQITTPLGLAPRKTILLEMDRFAEQYGAM